MKHSVNQESDEFDVEKTGELTGELIVMGHSGGKRFKSEAAHFAGATHFSRDIHAGGASRAGRDDGDLPDEDDGDLLLDGDDVDDSSLSYDGAPSDPYEDEPLPPLISRRLLITSAIATAVALVVVYAFGVIYFKSHFGFNTTIDGRNMTRLTVEQAEQRMEQNASRFSMRVTGREELEFNISGSDVGLRYYPDGQLDRILASQNSLLWPVRLLRQPTYTTQPSFRFEMIWLETFLGEVGVFNPDRMRAPLDARPVFVDGVWTVEKEDIGTTLNEDAVFLTVSDHLLAGIPECDLNENECYVNPTCYADDPRLLERVEDYNAYTPFQIIYQFGDQTEVLNGAIAIEWFVDNGDGTKTLDTGRLDAWLDGFCARHNTLGSERRFQAARGEELTVSGGSYGWQINRSAEREAILRAIREGGNETREPIYWQRASSFQTAPGQVDWGNTYIEIDQGIQKLFYYVNGEIVLETDIVTGLPTPMWTTPCGVYYVLSRVSPARLRGPIQENGEPMWDSTVNFWMGVTTGGVGIHDAYWQPWFGGTRYQYGGSHGCINLPYTPARDLYYMVEEGTPVIIHW